MEDGGRRKTISRTALLHKARRVHGRFEKWRMCPSTIQLTFILRCLVWKRWYYADHYALFRTLYTVYTVWSMEYSVVYYSSAIVEVIDN